MQSSSTVIIGWRVPSAWNWKWKQWKEHLPSLSLPSVLYRRLFNSCALCCILLMSLSSGHLVNSRKSLQVLVKSLTNFTKVRLVEISSSGDINDAPDAVVCAGQTRWKKWKSKYMGSFWLHGYFYKKEKLCNGNVLDLTLTGQCIAKIVHAKVSKSAQQQCFLWRPYLWLIQYARADMILL